MTDNPEFADPMSRPRYTGLPTFMRAPYSEDLSQIDIALVGIPFDGGVTNRPGARHGPREIRNQSSLMRMINQASRIAPFNACPTRGVARSSGTPMASPSACSASAPRAWSAAAGLADGSVAVRRSVRRHYARRSGWPTGSASQTA